VGIPPLANPWLSLGQTGSAGGSIRDIRINGQPRVLDQVDLSARSDLDVWAIDPDEASDQVEAAAWTKRGVEIVGRFDHRSPGARSESLLRLRRPLAEDGEVAFEFFHDPDRQIEVHPTLGRLVLLLGAEGVRLHRLTDGRHDRSGLAPDNTVGDAPGRRGPVPLKAGEWNRAGLAVTGDTLTLKVNDTLVYEAPIEPSNIRTFGVFHFSDESEARVRDVHHRGEWPKQVPTDLGFGG